MEFLINFFKDAVAYIIVAILGIVTGLIIGLNATGNEWYLDLLAGDDIRLGIGKPEITDYTLDDLKEIPDEQAAAFCTTLSKLDNEDVLSKKLQDLRDNGIGPFKPKPVKAYVKFIDNDTIKGRSAGGCWGGLINMELRMWDVIEPNNLSGKVSGMVKLDVLQEVRTTPFTDEPDKSNTIWINKKLACEWLNINDENQLPNWVKVDAEIIRKYPHIRPRNFFSGYFSEHALN